MTGGKFGPVSPGHICLENYKKMFSYKTYLKL